MFPISVQYILLVWHAQFESYTRFFNCRLWRNSISTARGRLRPEVTSPVNRVDHGFLFIFGRHLPSILYRFDVIRAFVIVENGRKTISAARGRVRPEVKLPFDSLTPI
jgi:hypothetical protein